MMEVFLGGTCNGSTWREELIPKLKIDYFNPVVEDWNEEAQRKEIEKRETCDFCLYVITKEMKGVYSIAEVVDDSNKRPEKTIFSVKKEGFDEQALRSLDMVGKMVKRNGGNYLDFDDLPKFLNGRV